MSMTRNDALTTLSKGIRKFEGWTAGQVIEAQWSGLKGLDAKDLDFFYANANKPARKVAQACGQRSYTNPNPQV
jgi:hypothetical protein